MVRLLNLGLTFAFLLLSLGARADFKGYVDLGPHKSIYVELIAGQPGKPTLVLLNGLTYDTRYWAPFVKAFKPFGYSILMYDPVGMGRTLIKENAADNTIAIEQQAADLDALTNRLGLRGKLNVMGLSYGGGLAAVFAQRFPQRTQNAIAVCPYTEPLTQQDLMIKSQIATTRVMFPLNPASDDELYAFFLWQNINTTYPMLEPSILDFPLKKRGVFQLVQGLRKYDFQAVARAIPPRTLHLVRANLDEYIASGVLERWWALVNPIGRASKLVVQSSHHKIPEEQPEFLARWVNQILIGNPALFLGQPFDGDPETTIVRGPAGAFKI